MEIVPKYTTTKKARFAQSLVASFFFFVSLSLTDQLWLLPMQLLPQNFESFHFLYNSWEILGSETRKRLKMDKQKRKPVPKCFSIFSQVVSHYSRIRANLPLPQRGEALQHQITLDQDTTMEYWNAGCQFPWALRLCIRLNTSRVARETRLLHTVVLTPSQRLTWSLHCGRKNNN